MSNPVYVLIENNGRYDCQANTFVDRIFCDSIILFVLAFVIKYVNVGVVRFLSDNINLV